MFPVRIITGLVAPAVFPLVWFVIVRAAGGSTAWLSVSATAGAILMYLLSFPVFVTAGTAFSIGIDAVSEKLRTIKTGKWLLEYVVKSILYICAGFLTYAVYAYAVTGGRMEPLLSAEGSLLMVAASLTYFHVGLLVEQIARRWRWVRFRESIETERLMLHPLTPDRYKAAKAKGYPVGDHVQAYIGSLRRHPGLLGWGVWLVQHKDTGETIGDAGFKGNPDDTRSVDIGYGFLSQHRGQGYATEAANALIDWAFEHGAVRVTAATLRNNEASIRVLRKNGFQLYREDEYFYWHIHLVDRLRKL